jgi:hypothetical protein
VLRDWFEVIELLGLTIKNRDFIERESHFLFTHSDFNTQ